MSQLEYPAGDRVPFQSECPNCRHSVRVTYGVLYADGKAELPGWWCAYCVTPLRFTSGGLVIDGKRRRVLKSLRGPVHIDGLGTYVATESGLTEV